MNNRRIISYVIAVVVCFILFRYVTVENYKPLRGVYGTSDTIDTNPEGRVSQFFDMCSPEDFESCEMNNPYEGLPLP